MNDTQIFPVSIHDICRPISKDEFNPDHEEDIIYYPAKTPQPRPVSRLLLDDLESNPGLIRPPGKDRTFVAHLRDPLLIHDAMCIVASNNRVPLPETWSDYSMFHAVDFYHNRPTHREPYPVTWTEELLNNELEYYIHKSAHLTAMMINGPGETVQWNNSMTAPNPATPNYAVGVPHILLSNIVSTGYFHFVMDILPRLWIYDEWPELRQYPIVISPLGDKLEQALAELIGVPRSQLIVLSSAIAARFSFNHLIFPSAVGDRVLSAERLAFIRSKVTGRRSALGPVPWRRVYLSRSDRPYKTVANEAEVQAVLKDYGFEIIVGSELTISEQAKLFGETELLVGAGGGGLANMAFMQPASMVLELTQTTPPVLGQKRKQIIMELAHLGQIHHVLLRAQTDIHQFPRFGVEPAVECPTSMVYDPQQLGKAVAQCLAMLERQKALPHRVGA